jgi:protein-L-isoaspartate(D-aspartate) O-methyltransferase
MVEDQIVARGIKNPRLLAAMRKIPRHLFVDPGLLPRAYDDSSLPIGEKQTVSQPYMAARMTEALELSGEEKVLELGTGSGYQTALLAELSFNVFSVEKIRALATKARGLLDRLQYHNIAIQVGDGTIGWPEHAPFDAIIVTAGAPDLPRPLVEQLAIGGRLVIPIGDEQSQVLVRVIRQAGRFEEEQLGDCRFVKLWGKFGWQE